MPEAADRPGPLVPIRRRGIVRTLPARTASTGTSPARTASTVRRGRRLATVLAAAALVGLGLTGCSATSASSCTQPGDASELVRASGGFGAPTASFPHPLHASSIQKSTLKKGDGQTLEKGDLLVGQASYYNGATGKPLGDSGEVDLMVGGKSAPGLAKAIACSTIGSRVVVTGGAKELFGDQVQTGLAAGSTAVFVIDLQKTFPSRATGAPRPSQPGMPTVVLAPDGQPGIKIPANDAPTKLRTAVLKQGSGPVVKKVDGSHSVLVNYTAVTWNSPDTVASSSWLNGSPTIWPNSALQGFTPPASVTKQLVGKNVGSQILVVTPGSNATAFVIDILGIWK
jgi:peptidylprolyl isomerase